MRLARHLLATAVASACMISTAWAATVVENSDGAGQVKKILLEGNLVRMDAGPPGNYMLIDLAQQSMLTVDHNQKVIVDMFAKPPQAQGQPPKPPQEQEQAPRKVESKLVQVGAGPQVAGYPTTHYQVTANGEVCSNEFVSQDAVKVEYVENFVQAMQKIAESRKKAMGPMPFAAQMPPCMQAEQELEGELIKAGLSLRSTSKDGKVFQEVVKITPKVQTAPDTFALPQGYERTTPFDMMQRTMQEMQKMTPEQRQQMQDEARRRMEQMQQRQGQ